MEFSEYKYTRSLLSSTVHETINNLNLTLYGSFLTGCFHLPISKDYSFSDIDLIADSRLSKNDRTRIEKYIKAHIFSLFGINFRVSIRNERIHQDTLTDEVSYTDSFLETFIKLMERPLNRKHTHYQIAKLYLRIVHRHSYFTNGINFKHGVGTSEVLKKCCKIKTEGGFFTSQEVIACINEITIVSPNIGKDIFLTIDSGVFVEDIYQQYSNELFHNKAYKLREDILRKMILAKTKNNQIKWNIEKLHPSF